MYLRIKAQILFVAFIPSWPCLLLQPHPPLLHVNFRKAGCLPACGSTELMYCFQLHAFPRTSWLHFCCGLIHLSDCFAPGNPPEPSVQVSRIQLFATPWTAARQASLYITSSWSLLKLMSIELVMPSNLLILCHPLLLSSVLPSIRVFSSESALPIRWPKYWSFSFSISPSKEYSGLISFRINWLDILAVQRLYLLISFRRILEILWNLCRQLCHFANKQFCFSFHLYDILQ